MNIEEIRELIQLMKENGLSEIDIESEGERVQLKAEKAPQIIQTMAQGPAGVPAPQPYAPPLPAPGASQAAEAAEPAGEPTGPTINSPIVGIFYDTPGPDKPPFVSVGDVVEESTVVCIVEAMKVMNEILAETKGTIRKILVEKGHPVEYGQPLFEIDPAS